MKGVFRFLIVCVLVLSNTVWAEKLPRLVLSGPAASISNPLIRMVESGALDDLADNVSFIPWRTPDQLRLMSLEGQADILAMPINVAANLYNRGAALRLLNVSSWGLLWLVSRESGLEHMEDLKGKEITVPFRGDMPDILFGLLAERAGLDMRKDFRIRYVATPMDAMQLLLMRRTDHALLAEPAVSMALRKSGSLPLSLVAPDLYRSVDLQQEWGRLFARPAEIPQAGIAVMGELRNRPEAVARIQQAYAEALDWCLAQTEACSDMVAKHFDMLTPEAIADSLHQAKMRAVPAAQAREEIEFFFQRLMEKAPPLIGNKMPPDDFYIDVPVRP